MKIQFLVILSLLFHTAFADGTSSHLHQKTHLEAAPVVMTPPKKLRSSAEFAKELGIEGEVREQHDFPYLNYLNNLKNHKYAPKQTVRILSIDGGGVRGIIPAMLVAEIERQLGVPITRVFHGFVGTSAGGILVLALNKPAPGGNPNDLTQAYSAAQVLGITEEMIHSVFKEPAAIASLLLSPAKHEAVPIETFLKEKFGNTTLRNTIRPVCISTFEITTENSLMLCTPMGIHKGENDLELRTVARATSAAPFYFPAVQVIINNTTLLLTDGGVGANNPALNGLLEMKKIYGKEKHYHIISLGTGIAKSGFEIEDLTKGSALKMLKPTLVGLFKAQDDITNDFMRELAKSEGFQYTRIQTFLPMGGDVLDDSNPETIALLKKTAQMIINAPEFKKMIAELKTELQAEQGITPKR